MKKSQRRKVPIVRIVRRGPMLSIKNVSKKILRMVSSELTYKYVQQLRGPQAKAAGTSIRVIPTACFHYLEDNDELQKPQILTNSGWYPRLRDLFTHAGYAVRYTDNTPESRGGARVDEPRWKQLVGDSFRYKQREVLELIASNPYGQIICPTGYGKSFLISRLAMLFPYARFVVTTHSKDVIEMLYEDLVADLPSVGLKTGGRNLKGRRVMCVSGKSLHHAPKDTDFLLVDEMQEFATADYMSRLSTFTRARMYGFSANPKGDRGDGADFELEGVFGPQLINIPYQEAVAPPDGSEPCIVQLKVLWLDVVMDVNPVSGVEDPTARLRHGIWRNAYRNEQIAAAAKKFDDQQVLILVDSIEHAVFLKEQLPEYTLVYAAGGLSEEKRQKYVRWGLINNDEPEMTETRRWELKKAFESGKLRKVIATTVWNKGVNFRQLQVLIRGDARASAVSDKQYSGRLSRIADDKNYGVLIDCYDQFDKTFERRALKRKGEYKKQGWDQIEPEDTLIQGELF